jgi:hypothetical protein
MRVLAVGGLALYGVANLFAGVVDITGEHRLPGHVEVLLIITGVLLLVGTVLVAKGLGQGWSVALTAIVLASLLAVYNERVLGLGHPSHHLIRGPYTLLVLYAAWRCTRRVRERKSAT